MHQFRVFVKGNATLHVEISDENGWDFNNAYDDCFVMMAVIELFMNELDPDLMFSGSIIIFYESKALCPRTYYLQNSQLFSIMLTAPARSWPQQAYQLAHELTHCFLRSSIDQENNWFFETIAEVASLFFLKKLFKVFNQYPVVKLRKFAPYFLAYSDNILNPAEDVKNPSEWYRTHELDLLQNKINRELNLQAAKILLPLFESLPGSWNVLLFANLDNTPLNVFLPKWIARVPEGNHPCRRLLQECHTIFLGSGECQKACPKNPAD